ncbi:hypothetical protein HETIRDRAFT_324225 [Heterobasidion irregulare TC 32-1]|uniref:Uncharacterized protein n=1 Tax=Heterobasidion irregulare (strain TC 32-1) TaxID=747525 RepID=W4K0M3_HETIT|nr:uncharacterized protein HETIRDRAFT_324225 [Heterobasidion irregulare TC 32-1]ETW79332.1 hypothetical protein HETIRDRAFT_324225 [Heterobasidion irregulare TC 32-1]
MATSNASASQPSVRWTHFYAALQLAIQRSAHKWTYEDFVECFPLWCEEEKNGASGVFNTVSRFVENETTKLCDELFANYDVQRNLDSMHAVVTEARARKQSGEARKDAWRPDLEPRAAVRAWTIPLLQQERDRLRAQLAQLEDENMRLQSKMQENVKARQVANDQITEMLTLLNEVYERWKDLPVDDMQSWTLQMAETQSAIIPPP